MGELNPISSSSVMRLLVVLPLMAVMCLGEEKKVTKLQIGVKKRGENCEMKSRKGDTLHMHYTGTLQDGTEFDSSIPRGEPLSFTLGSGQVIKGWDQGLLAMCAGEKRKLVIPPDLGYGDSGAGDKIPGGSVLIFEVELTKLIERMNYRNNGLNIIILFNRYCAW